MIDEIITAQQLGKRYGNARAVDGISFAVTAGSCVGFLGPNGAGKTTTMKMIYGSARKDSGSLTVFGLNVDRDIRAIKARLGVVPQENSLDPDITVMQNLDIYGSYYNLPRALRRERAQRLIRFMQLQDKRSVKITELSGGMQRRLTIARGFINDPDLIILDEPTTGLDPQARRLIWDNLQRIRQEEQKTMVITTHYMEEAAYLCDRVFIVDKGAILADGTPGDLIRKTIGKTVIEVRCDDCSQITALLEKLGGNIPYQQLKDRLYLYLQEDPVPQALLDHLPHQNVYIKKATLEDAFLKIAGYGLQDTL